MRVAAEADDPEALVVTILCDTGERYLSEIHDDKSDTTIVLAARLR